MYTQEDTSVKTNLSSASTFPDKNNTHQCGVCDKYLKNYVSSKPIKITNKQKFPYF